MEPAAALPLSGIENRAARGDADVSGSAHTLRAHLVDELMRELGTTPWEQVQAGCSPADRRSRVAITVAEEIQRRAGRLHVIPTDVRVFAHEQPGSHAPLIMVSAWNRSNPPPLRMRPPVPDPAGWDPWNPLDERAWRACDLDLSLAPICFGLYSIAPTAFD